MGVRSKLLFEAQRQVSNPFLLCTLISKRTRQLMMSSNGAASAADLVDYALSELIAGAPEFEGPGTECLPLDRAEDGGEQKNEALVQQSQPTVKPTAQAETT